MTRGRSMKAWVEAMKDIHDLLGNSRIWVFLGWLVRKEYVLGFTSWSWQVFQRLLANRRSSKKGITLLGKIMLNLKLTTGWSYFVWTEKQDEKKIEDMSQLSPYKKWWAKLRLDANWPVQILRYQIYCLSLDQLISGWLPVPVYLWIDMDSIWYLIIDLVYSSSSMLWSDLQISNESAIVILMCHTTQESGIN